MAAYLPNTIRGATASGFIVSVNADGSINMTAAGTKNIAAGSTATQLDIGPGILRDPVSGTPMVVNSDGSINYATS